MTEEQLREIEERANAATDNRGIGIERWVANTEFLAHARTDVPALIAEVRRLNKALEEASEFASADDGPTPRTASEDNSRVSLILPTTEPSVGVWWAREKKPHWFEWLKAKAGETE